MEAVLGFLKMVFGFIFFFLPDDPFMPVIEGLAGIEWLAQLNWVLPIGEMLVIGGTWLAAIVVFYAYQAILRIANIIGS